MQYRFTLSRHIVGSESHFDFFLEHSPEKKLWTWQIKDIESIERILTGKTESFRVPALRTFDHRKTYLDYEGEISENRGNIQKKVTGFWNQLSIDSEKLVIFLISPILIGKMELIFPKQSIFTEIIPFPNEMFWELEYFCNKKSDFH